MDNTASGKNIGVLCDGFDVQRLLSTASSKQDRDDIDTTTFGQGDKSNMASLRGGVLSCEGFYHGNDAFYDKILSEAIGPNDVLHLLTYCPEGYAFGNQAVIFKSNQNSYEVGAPYTGAVMTSIVWGATGGKRLGNIIHTHAGNSVASASEVQTIDLTNANPNQFFALRAVSTTPSFNFNTTTTNPQFKAGIEGLAAYAGRVVTVTGTTVKTITFDGSTGVPSLEAITGAVRKRLVLNGDSGNYSFGNGAVFTLPITQANFDANQKAIGGAFANSVSIGSGVGFSQGTPSFAFSGGNDQSYNVTYNDAGDFDGVRYYTSNNGRFLFRGAPTGDGSKYWQVAATLGGAPAYLISSTASTPPLGAWSAGGSGLAPAPTASQGPNSGAKNFNVSGTGDSNYDGKYSQAGQNDGVDYFINPAGRSLYRVFANGIRFWAFSVLVNDDANTFRYSLPSSANTPPLGQYNVSSGGNSTSPPAPGPTVSAGSVTGSSLDFATYFPIGATPGALAATGTGASSSETFPANSAASSIVIVTANQGGTSSAYNLVTAAGDGATFDGGATANTGFVSQLHAIYGTGSGRTLTVKLQHSDSPTTGFSDLATFDVVTASGRNGISRVTLPKGTAVKRYRRASVVSITGTWAFSVSFSTQGPDI